jgi:hypothetical protein
MSIKRLAANPFCAIPPDLATEEQTFALHQFIHAVLTAGYALYQKVPPHIADPVIEEVAGKLR